MKFALTKYEMILLNELQTKLPNNCYKIPEEDWKMFLKKDDFKNVEKILNLDLSALSFQLEQNYNEYIEPLKVAYSKAKIVEMEKLINSSNLDFQINNNEVEDYLIFFGNLIPEFLGYFRPKIEKIKV